MGQQTQFRFKIKPLRAIIIIELDKLFVFIIISGTQNKLNIYQQYKVILNTENFGRDTNSFNVSSTPPQV